MSKLSTRVFDTARGRPADGLPVALERHTGEDWRHLAGDVTGEDGRVEDLLPPGAELERGTYRLTFDTGTYFAANDMAGIYPVIRVVFEIQRDGVEHHVPLQLSPYGYATHIG